MHSLDQPSALPGGIFHWRGKLGIVGLAPLLLLTVTSPIHAHLGEYAYLLCSAIGALLIVIGVGWRSWAMLFVGGRKSRELVQEGPYSLSRHPLYFGSFLVALGAGVMLQSLTFSLVILLGFPWLYLPVIAEEERILQQNHGQSFRDFCERVPQRLFPRWHTFAAGGRYQQVHLRAQWNQAKRGLVTLAAIPMLELLQTMRSNGVLPEWLTLP